MTREEEIKQAAYSQCCNSKSICFTLMCDSFKQGAKWADEHPINVWHDASKEPKNGKTILLFYGSDFPSLLHKRATLRKWKEYVNGMKVIRWAYVEDLVPNTL